jgi:pilus assembly protein Flp/PilA
MLPVRNGRGVKVRTGHIFLSGDPTSFAKPNSNIKEGEMNNLILSLYAKFQGLRNGEEGQDLVEYALLVCLIALAVISGVQGVASAVNSVFSNISTSLA